MIYRQMFNLNMNYLKLICNIPRTGGGAKGHHRHRTGHGSTLGSPLRHDHNQQRYRARLSSATGRDQFAGTRAAMGARPVGSQQS